MNTSAPAQWFRMYAEFAVDPKIQMLSEIDQRRFVMLLCLRCCNGNVTLHETEVAFQLRISGDEWAKTKAVLLDKKLIHDDNNPTAWDKRQYASDSSTARVSKHRDKVKRFGNVTKEKCNGDVTAPETETETETEKKDIAPRSAKRFTPPSQEDVKNYCSERKTGVDPDKWFNFYEAKGWMVGRNKMKDWKAAVRTWEDAKPQAQEQQEDKKCAGCGILLEFGSCNGKTAESRACANYEQRK